MIQILNLRAKAFADPIIDRARLLVVIIVHAMPESRPFGLLRANSMIWLKMYLPWVVCRAACHSCPGGHTSSPAQHAWTAWASCPVRARKPDSMVPAPTMNHALLFSWILQGRRLSLQAICRRIPAKAFCLMGRNQNSRCKPHWNPKSLKPNPKSKLQEARRQGLTIYPPKGPPTYPSSPRIMCLLKFSKP